MTTARRSFTADTEARTGASRPVGALTSMLGLDALAASDTRRESADARAHPDRLKHTSAADLTWISAHHGCADEIRPAHRCPHRPAASPRRVRSRNADRHAGPGRWPSRGESRYLAAPSEHQLRQADDTARNTTRSHPSDQTNHKPAGTP